MSIHVRSATSNDVYAVVSLVRARDLPSDGLAELVRAHPQHVLVAELSGIIVGVSALDVRGSCALMRSVAVASDLSTLGVGSRLVTDLLALARANQLSAVYLLTTTAERWFPRFGFSVVDRALVPKAIADTIEFTKACPSSAIAMQCTLTTP